MTHSFTRCYVHVIFATRHRRRLLTPDLRPDLITFMSGAVRRGKCAVVAVNAVDDHVHILMRLDKTRALADVVREVKASSSHWLKHQTDSLRDFRWQAGYSAFSVSITRLAAVKRYIERQEEHHAMMTFDVEYIRMLRRHNIEFHEEDIWS